MSIHDIPYHLRNTVEFLEAPVFMDLEGDYLRLPGRLAIGDTLMVLGFLRNLGRPLRLCLGPGAGQELVEAHPLVREVLPPEPIERFGLTGLPVGRFGRGATWTTSLNHRIALPVLPVDQVRANPIRVHSHYYGLDNQDDRPSVFVDPDRPPQLRDLISRRRPVIVVYPLNPGRDDCFWQDPAWWMRLLAELRRDFTLIAVGAPDYSELAGAVDHALKSDDPASTLPDLAWLMSRAQGFAGRDGGLAHLAGAVNHRRLIVWDSMASYRYWAGGPGHHLLLSNPYVFRYPQTARLSFSALRQQYRAVSLPDGQGGMREELLTPENWDQRVSELFGSPGNLLRTVLAQRELEEERAAVAAWMGSPEMKARFYEKSIAFAVKAMTGGLGEGENWVAPLMP